MREVIPKPPVVEEVPPETRRWLSRESQVARRPVAVAAALGVTEGLLAIAQAALVAGLVGRGLIEPAGEGELLPLFALLVGVVIFRAAVTWAREAAGARAGGAIREQVHRRLAEAVIAAGPARVGRRSVGELATVVVEQVEALEEYGSSFLPQRWVAALVPAVIVVIVASRSWAGALILLVTAPTIPFFSWLIGLGAARASQRQFLALGRLSALFLDRLRGLATLRLHDRVAAETGNLALKTDEYRKRTMSVLRVAFLSSAVLELFSALGLAMMAIYLGFTLLGHWSFGFTGRPPSFEGALFLLILTADFYLPLRALGALHHARASALGAAQVLRGLIEELTAEDDGGPRGTKHTGGELSLVLEGVTVASSEEGGRPILRDLSLRVSPGERLVVVGRSGAGKTTLLNLILGLVEPAEGRVRIGGVDLTELDLEAWRRRVGWVGQRPYLFHGTLWRNIALGHPGAHHSAITAAARKARVLEFAKELPAGVDTVIGEDGLGLSGGQIQRVALARALLGGPPVLLLDEPTANLDVESEGLLVEALDELSPGRTVVTVTHRLALCRGADRVVVLDDGRLVAEGRPEEIFAELGHLLGLGGGDG